MGSNLDHIYPVFDKMLPRDAKEKLLGQRGAVIWMYGLSGSGKTTLANLLERRLHEKGKLVKLLDGDNIRSGLNSNLGFSDEDRIENIRRVAEVAKLFADSGIITVTSFITPNNELRDLARGVIGNEDLLEVYIKASFKTCAKRDPKGLYAKARAGQLKNFTGIDSPYEEPEAPEMSVDTVEMTAEEAAEAIVEKLLAGGFD